MTRRPPAANGLRARPWGAAAASLLIVALAVVWLHELGDPSADAIRRGLREVTAVRLLELVALLTVIGLAGLVSLHLGLRAPFAGDRRSRRIPAGAPLVALTAIVAVATVFRAVLGHAATAPTVLGDELIYTDLAKSIVLHGEPLLRGDLRLGYSILQPAVMSPVYAISANGATALEAIKVVNAIAMAATAIPAYLLARRILSAGWSLIVAALSVAAPWTAYAAFPMTESVSYLAFTSLALALAMTLEQPAARRQIALMALLAVAVAARPQALVLVVSVVAAVVLDGLLARRLRARLREFRLLLAAIGATVVAGVVLSAAGVPIPTGSYSVLYRSLTSIFDIAKWAMWSAGAFELALGGVALAACPIALARLLRRDAAPAERAFGATAATFLVGVLASVALLAASPYGLAELHERSLFYVTPVVLTAFAYWLATGLGRPRTISAVAAVAALALPLTVPRRLLLFNTNSVDVPSSFFFRGLHDHLPGVQLLILTAGLTVAGVGTLLLARRPLFPLISIVVAFLATTAAVDYATPEITPAQARSLAWVDRALPPGAKATIVHMGFYPSTAPCAKAAEDEQQSLVIWTEYFNKAPDRLYHVYAPVYKDGLTSPVLTFGPGGSLLSNGRRVIARYVVFDSRQPVAGIPMARFDLAKLGPSFQNGASLTLWRALEPLRLPAAPNPLPPRSDGRGC